MEMQIFQNPSFGTVRTLEENGKILFCGSDIAKALGYKNPSKALSDHCKGVTKCYTLTEGGEQQMNFIPEGDIYRLAAKSELPGADNFESWIFDEVLPSIRKHGMYAKEELLDNPDLLIEVATRLKQEQQQRRLLEQKVQQDAPKVLFADAVAASHAPMLIGELAKILKQNGVDIGEKRLFQWLRSQGYLIKRKGTDFNAPTQKSMERKLFEVKETPILHSDGHVTVNRTTKVTGKGQQYFINLFLSGRQNERPGA